MEDTLEGALNNHSLNILSLNPCFYGRYSGRVKIVIPSYSHI